MKLPDLNMVLPRKTLNPIMIKVTAMTVNAPTFVSFDTFIGYAYCDSWFYNIKLVQKRAHCLNGFTILHCSFVDFLVKTYIELVIW